LSEEEGFAGDSIATCGKACRQRSHAENQSRRILRPPDTRLDRGGEKKKKKKKKRRSFVGEKKAVVDSLPNNGRAKSAGRMDSRGTRTIFGTVAPRAIDFVRRLLPPFRPQGRSPQSAHFIHLEVMLNPTTRVVGAQEAFREVSSANMEQASRYPQTMQNRVRRFPREYKKVLGPVAFFLPTRVAEVDRCASTPRKRQKRRDGLVRVGNKTSPRFDHACNGASIYGKTVGGKTLRKKNRARFTKVISGNRRRMFSPVKA